MPVPDFSPGEVLTAAAMDSIGLWKVGEFTASNTSRALVCDNVFTSEYENYQIIVRLNAVSNSNRLFFQYLDTTGATVSSGYYSQNYTQDYATSGSTGFTTQYTTSGAYIGWLPNNSSGPNFLTVTMTIYAPRLTVPSSATGQNVGINSGVAFQGGAFYSQSLNTTAHRGIRFDNDFGTNLTGSVKIYGYRN